MPVLMASFLEPRSSLHLEPATAFPSGQKGQRLRLRFRGYIWLRFRCNPQVCSAHFLGLCQGTLCFGLPLAPPSSYMGELPNSHGRTLTDKSYVIHGILSGTGDEELETENWQRRTGVDRNNFMETPYRYPYDGRFVGKCWSYFPCRW